MQLAGARLAASKALPTSQFQLNFAEVCAAGSGYQPLGVFRAGAGLTNQEYLAPKAISTQVRTTE